MKRFVRIVLTATVALFAGNVFAQDMNQAGELYQKAVETYQAGNELEAVKNFKEALKIAEGAGEEGAEMVANCKDMIPQILLAAAGKLVGAKDYAKAEEIFKEVVTLGRQFGNEDIAKKAELTLTQIPMQAGADALNNGNTAEAISLFGKAVELNPENATAYLYLGMAHNSADNTDEAEKALLKAKELGNDKAEQALIGMFINNANDNYKAKNFKDAITFAEKALAFGANPSASQIAGVSAYNLKNWSKAATHLKNAPSNNQFTYMIGTCYENLGNKAQACTFLKKIVNDAKFGANAKAKVAKLGC